MSEIQKNLDRDIESLKSGKELKFVQRQTGIWEQRDGNWVMIHEHLSAPSSLQ